MMSKYPTGQTTRIMQTARKECLVLSCIHGLTTTDQIADESGMSERSIKWILSKFINVGVVERHSKQFRITEI